MTVELQNIDTKPTPDTNICYKVLINHSAHCYVNREPFGNCQTYSIAFFKNIICRNNSDIKKIMKVIQDKISKTQFIIDISLGSKQKVIKLFGDHIKLQTEYTNNTGSKMVLMLINSKGIDGIDENEA